MSRPIPSHVSRTLVALALFAGLLQGAAARAENLRCLGLGGIPAGEQIVGYVFSGGCPLLPQPLYNAAFTTAPAENLQVCSRFLGTYYFIPSGWVAVPEPVTSARCNFGTPDTTSNNAVVLQQLSLIPGVGVTDSARFQGVITPGGLATAFGSGLASVTQSAACTATLGRAHVWVLDGQSAPLFRQGCLTFASPTQINFQVPGSTPAAINTTGRVFVYNLDLRRIVGTGAVPLRPTAPALFTQNAAGTGRAAADLLRVRSDGSQVYQSINTPIDVNTTDDLYLILYGTGIRNIPSVSQVSTSVGGIFNTVVYAGPQGGVYDQVNVLLNKAALAGLHGEQSVVVSVNDNRTTVPTSNVVTVPFR